MAVSNWQRIREAFEQCLELPELERKSFLDSKFNGDDASRNEVMQLLEGDRQAVSSNFLDWESNGTFDIQNSLKPGERIGNYLVIQRVGSGGSGVVYKVHKFDDPSQDYALKVLHSWRNNAEGIRRFQQEIEVLQQLDHPGIAKCLEYGVDNGVLFLVMALIEGEELDQYLLKAKTSVHRRVELFHQVCEAVAHAHEHLILHRDLKPANIMIDRKGNPIVMDFGLAKLVGEPSDSLNLTTTGRIIGTPSYMAPEQTGSTVAPSMTTDVYGLGAVLYFLLTDRPPFTGSNLFEVGHAIRTDRPQNPQSLDKTIDSRLAAICIKCLEKSPGNRYPAVAALSEDIDRYLKGIPVLAKPRSSTQQLLDWARQNKWVSLLSATLVLSLVIGLVSTVYFWRNSTAQTNLLLEMVQQQVDEIKTTIDDPDSLASRARELRFLTETFGEFERLANLDEKTRDSAAESWFLLGRAEGYLGNRDAAVRAYEEALERFRLLTEDYPNALDYQFDVFHCLNSLWRHDEALIQAQLLVAADGEQNSDYLAALGAELYWHAEDQINSGEFRRARETTMEGLEFANRHFGPKDGTSPYRRRIAAFQWLLGRLELVDGNLDAAIAYLRSSSELQRRLIDEYPANDGLRRDLYRSSKFLCAIHFHLNDIDIAEELLVELEAEGTVFRDSFRDFYHAWQPMAGARRIRWIFENEYGTEETSKAAGNQLHKYLVEWSERFPQKIQAKAYLAWYLTHPDNSDRDFDLGEKLIDEVLASNEPDIRHVMFERTLMRLAKTGEANELLDSQTEYQERIQSALRNFWDRF